MSMTTRRMMTALALVVAVTSVAPRPALAQTVREVFERVSPSVVVIRARGRDVTASGQTRYTETGSGVLISAAGKS
jgi:hypothetical protein